MKRILSSLLGLGACLVLFGCAALKPGATAPKPDYPAGTQFLYANAGDWSVTSQLDAKRTAKGFWISHSKADVWPVESSPDGKCNANLWILANRGGQWKAATWEWAKPSTHDRPIKGTLGSYIKNSAFAPGSWNPAPGERVGIMISGMARGGASNVKERSNIVWLTW